MATGPSFGLGASGPALVKVGPAEAFVKSSKARSGPKKIGSSPKPGLRRARPSLFEVFEACVMSDFFAPSSSFTMPAGIFNRYLPTREYAKSGTFSLLISPYLGLAMFRASSKFNLSRDGTDFSTNGGCFQLNRAESEYKKQTILGKRKPEDQLRDCEHKKFKHSS
uniref:Uncharacterized protein n=1 Tax=Bursaphelenchus xylophilus TaxID=6326 RepID=A0A1I7S9I3_BURXY